MKEFLEAGRIVNTHGIRGEVKIQPWADTPDFLKGFAHLYIDGAAVRLLECRVHKDHLIARLEGLENVNDAMRMKNKTVFIRRSDADLAPGTFFIQDIIGLPVRLEDGSELGRLQEVLNLPTQDVYVVQGAREYLIPDVPAFIVEKNPDKGYILVRLMEGL